MLHPPWWYPLAALATIAVLICVPIYALHSFERRRRTSDLRRREYPAWEAWLASFYPKATKDEAELIRCLMEGFGRVAHVEPTQLRPDDRLLGVVFPPMWLMSISVDGPYEELYDEAIELLERKNLATPDWAPWERDADDSWETVGDVVDFMLKRFCTRTQESPER